MKLSFIGDVCLARQIGTKHKATNYNVVSNEVKEIFKERDYVIANLESQFVIKLLLMAIIFHLKVHFNC